MFWDGVLAVQVLRKNLAGELQQPAGFGHSRTLCVWFWIKYRQLMCCTRSLLCILSKIRRLQKEREGFERGWEEVNPNATGLRDFREEKKWDEIAE